ncbi:MAG: MoaD/ThiS family protein [Thermofilum sp.]|nr:MoaD/ThiS family protein [Thermofilum sp.]
MSLFRDIAARREERVELPGGARLRDLVRVLSERYNGLKEYLERGDFIALVNGKVAELEEEVPDNSEVVIMPPISGG